MSMAGFRRARSRRAAVSALPTTGGGSDREARDTGHIYTQSELDESLARNQSSAASLREDFAGSLTRREDAALQDVEGGGFMKMLRGVGSILDVIDRPRRLVALGLQDIAEVDKKTEATLGHYWDVAMGRKEETVQNLGREVAGERGDISGSVLLDSMKWEKTDNWFNKIARGATQFGLEVALDPATYATGGGSAVGGKAALASMRATTAKATREALERVAKGAVDDAVETAFERGIREAIEREAVPIQERLLAQVTEEASSIGLDVTDDIVEETWQMAYREAAGIADDFAEEVGLEQARDLAAGVFGRKVDELAEPIATRRWDGLSDDYIDHVFTKRNGERLGDAFTTGGIRLGVPFSMKLQTRALPGTRGLFRRIPGVRQLSKVPRSRFGRRFSELMPLVDAEAPILQAARRGEGYAMLSYAENLTRAASREVGSAQMQRETVLAAQRLDDAMTQAGLDEAGKDDVWRLIYPSMQVGQVAPDVTRHGDAVVEAAQEFVEAAHGTIGRAYQFLRKVDPNGVGFIESHIPLMFGDDFTRAMQTIAGSQRGMPFTIETAADASRIADELGVSLDELWLWLEAFDGTTTIGRRGLRGAGRKAVINKRRMGRTATSRRGTFTTVDENGSLIFMRRPAEAAAGVDDDVARIASGEYADEVRRTAGYAPVNEDAVPQLIASIRVTESRLPAKSLVGLVTSPKTGEEFRVYLAREGDRYAYSVLNEQGDVMGGVIGSGTNFSMGLADDARGVMDQVWDIALEHGHDLLRIHGRGASTSEDALLFGQRRAQRLVQEKGGGVATLTDTTQRAWMDQGDISDALAKVTNAVNERYNLGLKQIDDGLTRDPVKLVGDYLAQMQALAAQRALRKSVMHLGGITQVRTATNLEGVLDAIAGAAPATEDALRRIAAANQESIVDILGEEPKMTRVQLGGERYVEIPAELAEHRRIKPLLKKLRNMSQRIEGQRRTLQAARAREARNIVETTGMSPQMAADIVNATTGDVARMRAEFLAEVEAVTEELREAAMEAWYRTARDGVDAEEALAVAIAHKHDLKVRARQALADAEEAWAEQFPEILDEFEDVDVPLRFMNYDDPVQYAEGVQKLFGPVVSHMAEQRQRQLIAIQERLAALTEERAELMERILKMGDEKNTRTLTVGPGMQQNRSKLEARVAQIDNQASALESLGEYVAGARTADDIHEAVIFQEVARDLSNAATSEAAITWDGPVQAGLQRISALLDAGALDEATAKSARVNLGAIADGWENFVRASEQGATSLSDEVFDSPWFWRVLANGYLAERDAVREAAEAMRPIAIRDGLDADEIADAVALYEALHMPDLFTNITDAVQNKIDRVRTLAEHASQPSPASTPGRAGKALEQLGDMYDALPNRRSNTALVAATADERAEMVEEIVAFHQTKLNLLLAEDEEIMINELGRYLRAYLTTHQANLTGRIAATGAGEEIGGHAYALDRVIRDVLSAADDPSAAMRAIKDQAVLQDAFERVYPNMKVRLVLSPDGFRIRMSKLVPTSSKVRPPEPKKILELLSEGKVTADQLRDNGLGYVADLFDLRRSFTAAQKRVASQRRATTRQLAESARIRQDYEELLDVVTSTMGSGQARRLRDWVHTGTAKGSIVRSDRYRKLLNVLPQNEAEQLDRIVQRALYLNELPSKEARQIARLSDEDFWLERIYEPLEATTERLQSLAADLRAETVNARVAEVEQFQGLADEFLSHYTTLQTLARDTNDSGLATAGNRIAEHTVLPDGRTAAEVLDDVRAAGKALEGAAPPGLGRAEIKAFLARLEDGVEEIPLPTEGLQAAERLGIGGQLQGYEVDPLVAAVFRNMIASHDAMFTPVGLSSMRKASREVLRWWRGAATVARVPFHARNLISALANGMLISVGPNNYAAVMPDYVAYRRALHNGENALDAVSPANRALFQAAIDEEVIGSGFVRTELGVALGTGGAKAKLNPVDADNFILFRGGAEMMQTLEDSVRLAAFHRWFDDAVPETAAFARQMVMVAHFDYQHLGELEQKFKAVAPFFVWTRRNVPLQLRAIVESPAYITTFGHISSAMKDNFGSDDRPNLFSPYASSLAAPLPFGEFGDEEAWSRFIFDPDLPFDNLEDFPLFANRRDDTALPFGAGALSPSAWVKWGTQLLAPQWSFAGEAAYGEPFQTNAPTGLNEVLRLLNTVDFFDIIQDPSAAGDVKVSSQMAQAYRTALPFATEYLDFFGGNSPTREARMGFTNEPESLSDRLIAFGQSQFASGLGLSRQTPSDLRGRTFDASEFVKEQSLRLRERMPQG